MDVKDSRLGAVDGWHWQEDAEVFGYRTRTPDSAPVRVLACPCVCPPRRDLANFEVLLRNLLKYVAISFLRMLGLRSP